MKAVTPKSIDRELQTWDRWHQASRDFRPRPSRGREKG